MHDRRETTRWPARLDRHQHRSAHRTQRRTRRAQAARRRAAQRSITARATRAGVRPRAIWRATIRHRPDQPLLDTDDRAKYTRVRTHVRTVRSGRRELVRWCRPAGSECSCSSRSPCRGQQPRSLGTPVSRNTAQQRALSTRPRPPFPAWPLTDRARWLPVSHRIDPAHCGATDRGGPDSGKGGSPKSGRHVRRWWRNDSSSPWPIPGHHRANSWWDDLVPGR